MSRVVLDASAILALLHDEEGATEVAQWVAEGMVSSVNFAEVVGKLMEAGMPKGPAVDAVETLALEVVDFDVAMAIEAGALRPPTKSLGLSLGDHACLGTAMVLNVHAVTADRSWEGLEVGPTVRLVR